jgi:GTP cyclohydrolase I
MFDEEKVILGVKYILGGIGEDVNRQGLIETPKRVARYYKEIFEGLNYSNEQIAKMYNKVFDDESIINLTDELIVVNDISTFSMCEHHLALIYDIKISVGYIPNKKVIGLSKINRVCKMVSKRPQLQEKMQEDIFECLKIILDTNDIAIVIRAKHGCITSRGINDINSNTITSKMGGNFKKESQLRNEFLRLAKV